MDLLFKNRRYFWKVYFNFSVTEYLKVFGIFFMSGVVLMTIFKVNRLKERKVPLRYLVEWLLFSAYIAAVVGITLLNQSRRETQEIILNPIKEFQRLFGEMSIHYLRGSFSNILLFVPFGIFVAAFFHTHPLLWSSVLGLVCSAAIEVAQYQLHRGTAETWDVICNFIGAMIGGIFAIVIRKIVKKIFFC